MKLGEHKTVQARFLEYAEATGWTLVSREEAERRRGFDPDIPPADRARNCSLFSDDLLDTKVREFNPRYAEAEGALLGQVCHLHTDIYGNREFVEHLRNRGKFFDVDAKRERDLILIDYDAPSRNVYKERGVGTSAFATKRRFIRRKKEPAPNKPFYMSHKDF